MKAKEKLININLELKELQENKQENEIVQKQIYQSQAKIKKYEHSFEEAIKENQKEQRDVEKIQKLSFSNFYHSIKNDKSEQLDKEMQEALQAKNYLDIMKIQLEEEQVNLEKLKTRLKPQEELIQKYNQLLNEKRGIANLLFPQIASVIENEEKEISNLEQMIKEIDEAIMAGKKVEAQAKDVLSSLNSARNWGTFDIIGGGLVATAIKHGHMEEAQRKIQKLDSLMKRFNNELDDIDYMVVSGLNTGNFIGFADWFFDGLFVDLTVQSKIKNAEYKVNQTEQKIIKTIRKLKEEKRNTLSVIKNKEKIMEEQLRNI